MSSFGAKVNPVGGVTADFGTGYPYYFMARLTVGAFNVKPLGLDLGVEFQTFFEMYDLSVHGRLQLVETGPLALARQGEPGRRRRHQRPRHLLRRPQRHRVARVQRRRDGLGVGALVAVDRQVLPVADAGRTTASRPSSTARTGRRASPRRQDLFNKDPNGTASGAAASTSASARRRRSIGTRRSSCSSSSCRRRTPSRPSFARPSTAGTTARCSGRTRFIYGEVGVVAEVLNFP